MAKFDGLYRTWARPWLFNFNAEELAYTYTSADGKTVYPNLDAINQEERWEVELTDDGERRIQIREISLRTEDLPATIQQKGKLTDGNGVVWLIERVASKSNTVTWLQCSSRKAFEQAADGFRR